MGYCIWPVDMVDMMDGGYGGLYTLDVFANLSPPLKLAALTDRRDKDAELIIRARLANHIELAALQNLCNMK